MKSDLLQPGPRRWLANSVFASVEEEYVSYLRAGRYHPNTVRVYFACVAHFGKWATEEGLDIALIDEAAQRRFLDNHVPSCDCPYPVRKLRHELRSEEHTSERQSLIRTSYAASCVKKKNI